MPLPSPPPIDGAIWRPATVGDAAAISRLQQACFEVDGGYRLTEEEFTNDLGDPDNTLADDTLLAVEDTGRAVALVSVMIPSGAEQALRIFNWHFVHPDLRGLGIEDFLMDWWEARGRERAVALDTGLPALFRTSAYDWQADRIELIERHGFEPTRYFVEMLRDLTDPVEPIPVAAGYAIEPWPEDSEEIRLLHNAAFRDHWGSEPRSVDEWQRYHLDEFLRADLSFVAVREGSTVAYLQATAYPHDFPDRGRTEAWVEVLGTAREHRKRGLASALISRALTAYRDDGFEYAAIGVDSESPTGALDLYESLGFVPEKRSIQFDKPIAV